MKYEYIKWFNYIDKNDILIVGGKGANLGELTQNGVDVPPGFCITADAYTRFIKLANLEDNIKEKIDNLDVEDSAELHKRSADVRKMIKEVEIPEELREEIISAYKEFSEKIKIEEPFVAIRSSATAEDLPEASFAGQQDTYLHISG